MRCVPHTMHGVATTALRSGVLPCADAATSEGPDALEAAASDLKAPGGVSYWTDYLKVAFRCKHTSGCCLTPLQPVPHVYLVCWHLATCVCWYNMTFAHLFMKIDSVCRRSGSCG